MNLHARWLLAALTLGTTPACGAQRGADAPRVGEPPQSTASSAQPVRPNSATIAATPAAPPPEPHVPPPATAHFPPPNVTPPSARSASADDGIWKAFDDAPPGTQALLYSTVLHPHPTSRFITVTLVAVDLSRTVLEFLPGVDDVGKQQVPFVPGLVPQGDRPALVAVFNGGFMPQHGRWGIRVGEATILPPRDTGCTIALMKDGRVLIRAWPALAAAEAEIRALRQTPPCLVEAGAVHPQLLAGNDRAWAGRTPGIVTRRRSAIGLDSAGTTLFYAIGVEASPKLLADGLRAAGADAAAQLDINWNWTRFLLFGTTPDGKLGVTKTLAEVEHSKRDYVDIAAKRDFFYLVRRKH